MDLVLDDHSEIDGEVKYPFNEDAPNLNSEEKINLIENHISEIISILGLDLNDDSIKGSPKRIAKMYVNELFKGLTQKELPKISCFENKYKYGEMLVEKNIIVYSTCEHHFLPIIGRAHVAYISDGKVIGLSKINRLVDHYAKRPQVQERLTIQIVKKLQSVLGTKDVACLIDAKHLCVNARGIKDIASSTVTSHFDGKFKEKQTRNEFLEYIKLKTAFE